jgi:hypothetical protein
MRADPTQIRRSLQKNKKEIAMENKKGAGKRNEVRNEREWS